MRDSNRWRRTDLTNGSYVCAAGGTVGVARDASVEGSERAATDDANDADMVVLVVEERREGRNNSSERIPRRGVQRVKRSRACGKWALGHLSCLSPSVATKSWDHR